MSKYYQCGSLVSKRITAKCQMPIQASSSLDAAIHLWDVDSGQKIRSVENGPMDAWTVTFSPCAEKVVSGSHVGKINMFSTETGQSEQGKERPVRRPLIRNAV